MSEISKELMELISRIKGSQLKVEIIREQLIDLAEIVGDIVAKMPDRKEVKGNEDHS